MTPKTPNNILLNDYQTENGVVKGIHCTTSRRFIVIVSIDDLKASHAVYK